MTRYRDIEIAIVLAIVMLIAIVVQRAPYVEHPPVTAPTYWPN